MRAFKIERKSKEDRELENRQQILVTVPRRSTISSLHPFYVTIAVVVISLMFWQLFIPPSLFIVPPSQFVPQIAAIWGVYAPDFVNTLSEYLRALFLSVTVGFLIGFSIGWKDSVFRKIDPIVGLALVSPKIALTPLIILWLGFSSNSAIVLGFLLGVLPVIVNTAAGVRNVNPEYLLLARSAGLSPLQMYWKIVIPSSFPALLVGIFFGSTLSMTGVVLMEMVIQHPSIGYLIVFYSNEFLTSSLYAASILTVIFTLAVSGTLWYISRYFEKRNTL